MSPAADWPSRPDQAGRPVPTGRNMLVLHPDQARVEYVEHRDKHPADVSP
ncbi:hypothetical protein ACVW1C_007363 [Bradyrhizobium sp. USDA 4011]